VENRSYALMTGLFVILFGLALVAASLWLGEKTIEKLPYYVVTTDSVSGLAANSAVRYRGVQVGQVLSIEFAKDKSGEILVRIEVERAINITKTTYANLRYMGVTGLAQINLDDDEPSSEPLDTSFLKPGRIAMRPSFLDTIGDSSEELLKNVRIMVANVNQLLDADTRGRIQDIVKNGQESTMRLNQLLKLLEPTLKQLPQLSAQGKETLAKLDAMIVEGNGLLMRTERLRSLGESAGEEVVVNTLPKLNSTLDELEKTIRNIQYLSNQLQRDPAMLLLGPSQPSGPGEKTGE